MFDLVQNGKIKGTFETHNQALIKLQSITPNSWDYSFKYDGWMILDHATDQECMTNYACDGACNRNNITVRRLDIGGGGGVFLCHFCWIHEMEWRKDRNKELEKQNQFDILAW